MSHLINLLITGIIFINFNVIAQEYKKEIVYVQFQLNEGTQPSHRGVKIDKKSSIQFNDLHSGSFLYSKNNLADTLSLLNLSEYKISSMKDIEEKILTFRKNTYKKRPPNNDDKLYQAYTKNDLFETYLIEIINKNQFVIYPVIWRNEGVEE